MSKKVNEIFKTHDYGKFTILHGNRALSPSHAAALAESMKEKYIPNPIICNERFQIIDGQHRFHAVQELELPLYYLVIPTLNLEDVQRLNSRTRNWVLNDYMDSHCDKGNINYIRYREFKDAFRFSHRPSLTLLKISGLAARPDEKLFREGKMMVTEDQIKIGRKKAQQILDLDIFYQKHETKTQGVRTRDFVNAMCIALSNKKFSYGKFITQLKKRRNRAKLEDQASQVKYQALIEDIYNFQLDPNHVIRVD